MYMYVCGEIGEAVQGLEYVHVCMWRDWGGCARVRICTCMYVERLGRLCKG